MKTLLIAALFATVAFAATVSSTPDNLQVHLHLDKPVSDKRFSGFVNRFIESLVDKKNVEVHFHVPTDNTEAEDEIDLFHIRRPKIRIPKHIPVPGPVKKIVDPIKEKIIDPVKDKILNPILDPVEKIAKFVGFDIEKEAIETAVHTSKKGFDEVRSQIASINLPEIITVALIKPVIEMTRIVEKMVDCAKSIEGIVPKLLDVAGSAVANDAAGSVDHLIGGLNYMPEISKHCTGVSFKIPAAVLDLVACSADIVALTTAISGLVAAPENVLNDYVTIKGLVDFVPKTIADCTGAFK